MGANCVASTSIGCLFCYKGCSAEKVRNVFTFIPPQTSYTVEDDGTEDKNKGRMVYKMEGLRNSALYRQAAESSEVRWVTTRKGNRVPMVWLRCGARKARAEACAEDKDSATDVAQSPLVLLHCHGNATDIGMMMGPYFALAKMLGVEVVGVEYSGYGVASGKPSSSNTCADLEAAYDEVVRSGVPPRRIVAYGQSVGSGPASWLAAKREVCGLVLHSPLLSGIKVVDPQPDSCCRPSCIWRCFDFYHNDRLLRKLTCPAFIMHGQRDEIIPFYHGYRLHKACPKASRWPPYFPTHAGHNDLVETDMRMYFGEISNFLQDLNKISMGLPVEPPGTSVPDQMEMLAKAVSLASASSPEGRPGEEAALPPLLQGPVGELAGAAPGPNVGPEDGRYENFRKGGIRADEVAAAGDGKAQWSQGDAREVVNLCLEEAP